MIKNKTSITELGKIIIAFGEIDERITRIIRLVEAARELEFTALTTKEEA
jgi:hypothetical protein